MYVMGNSQKHLCPCGLLLKSFKNVNLFVCLHILMGYLDFFFFLKNFVLNVAFIHIKNCQCRFFLK